MLSQEENELITNVEKGAPMGELFRRFWLPVALSEELPGPDCVPVRVRVMGEELIAFRNTDGRAALIDAFCPHRGAPLFFGRNEESGLRCVYHGWKYDADGFCVDMPNVPEGETYKHKIRLTSYPCVEAGQILWAYLGPAHMKPPFPEFEWADLPPSHVFVTKFKLECNYLQAMEGDLDQTHARFLHSTLDANKNNPANRIRGSNNNQLFGDDVDESEPYPIAVGNRRVKQLPWTDLEANEVGLWLINATDLDNKVVATANQTWMMPIFTQVGISGPATYGINMRTPIDNQSTYLYRMRWSRTPIPESEMFEYKYSNFAYPEFIPGTYLLKDNIHNDYNVDRVAQRNFSYTGIRCFPTQDVAMIENQWGAVAQRWNEHLASSDQQLPQIRRRLIRTARDLEAGIEPSEPWHPEGYSYHRARVVLDGKTREEAIEQVKEEARTVAKRSKAVKTELTTN